MFMKQLRGLGHAVGEYVGGGRSKLELEDDGMVAGDENRTDGEMVHDDWSADGKADREEDNITENPHPLLFFFDTETTGLSIHDDYTVEMASKVVGVPKSTVT